MDLQRRAYVRTVALGAAAGLAGCLGGDSEGDGEPTGTDAGSAGDDEYPVPESELRRGAPRDAIPAITEPAFGEDWSGVEVSVPSQFQESDRIVTPRLRDDDRVIGVERDGEPRAYPLRVLNWHEVVNDELGGPLLVTYCPLCRTGVTAVRRVDGEAATFGVSGLLYRSNLVMYEDVTESLWSQVFATAIRGPKAGAELELLASTLTSWAEWRDAHPGSPVLLPPPESNTVAGRDATRNYAQNPYAGYDDSEQVGIGRDEYDDRLHPKTVVVGVAHGDDARAYPLAAVREADVVNDEVGGLPVAVTVDPDGELAAYVRRVDGETVTFSPGEATTMRADGSAWRRSTGRALDGPHEGRTLDPANDRSPMFWFSWADLHPDSDVYGA